MKLPLASFLAILLALSVAGCANTIRGAGQDAANTVDAVGDAGENVAEEVD